MGRKSKQEMGEDTIQQSEGIESGCKKQEGCEGYLKGIWCLTIAAQRVTRFLATAASLTRLVKRFLGGGGFTWAEGDETIAG